MSYVDGFVMAVPTANKKAFIEHAKHADAILTEVGALRIVECWADDIQEGQLTDFWKAVNAKDEETVAFSWIEWPDKEARQKGMARMHELAVSDERFDTDKYPVPFDGMRMIFGGFEIVYEINGD